jgi:hypothetical protein
MLARAYVGSLIGPYSVTTLPEVVIDAFNDHGRVERTAASARSFAEVLDELRHKAVGIA